MFICNILKNCSLCCLMPPQMRHDEGLDLSLKLSELKYEGVTMADRAICSSGLGLRTGEVYMLRST